METATVYNNLKISSEMRYTKVVTDSEYIFGGHKHSSWEFKFVFRGSLEVTSDDTVVKLEPCDCMVIEPNVFHREITKNADYIVLQMELEGVTASGKSKVVQLDMKDIELLNLMVHYCEVYTQGKEEMVNKHGVSIKDERANHTLKKLSEVLIFNILSGNENTGITISRNSAIIYNKATNYMKNNLDRRLSLNEISKNVGACPTVLKTAFSKYTGHGIMQHFTYLRMNRAKELLREGLTASEVSSSLGFSSQSYFTQSFTHECGCTPTQYIKRRR